MKNNYFDFKAQKLCFKTVELLDELLLRIMKAFTFNANCDLPFKKTDL